MLSTLRTRIVYWAEMMCLWFSTNTHTHEKKVVDEKCAFASAFACVIFDLDALLFTEEHKRQQQWTVLQK